MCFLVDVCSRDPLNESVDDVLESFILNMRLGAQSTSSVRLFHFFLLHYSANRFGRKQLYPHKHRSCETSNWDWLWRPVVQSVFLLWSVSVQCKDRQLIFQCYEQLEILIMISSAKCYADDTSNIPQLLVTGKESSLKPENRDNQTQQQRGVTLKFKLEQAIQI